MRRHTETLADPACRMPSGGSSLPPKPVLKMPHAGGLVNRLTQGFVLPVLIVCATLWILLDGA